MIVIFVKLTFFIFFIIFISQPLAAEIKIALTFDDGPAGANKDQLSPTRSVLDTLKAENIAAAFFVLTGPDKLFFKTLPRGETTEGFNLIKSTAKEGHLIQCHWGGSYSSQTHLHPSSVVKPAYDFDGDAVIDKVTEKGNALESDLLQCIDRLQQVLDEENITDNALEYIRPPVWVFKHRYVDARPTYHALNLQMILTDAKLFDGGFGIQRLGRMMKDMSKAIAAGEKNIILTLHDAMPKTAKHLPKTIDTIRKKMASLNLVEGQDWSFTRSRKELKTLFDEKEYFYLQKYSVSSNPFKNTL